MKALVYIIAVLGLGVFSCKKQAPVQAVAGLSETFPIFFEIVDKNGNNIIHSANDTLVVTYSSNAGTISHRLNIFKIQISETDTALSEVYNGFVVCDYSWQYSIGYMSENINVTNYQFYLNGKSIGNGNYSDPKLAIKERV